MRPAGRGGRVLGGWGPHTSPQPLHHGAAQLCTPHPGFAQSPSEAEDGGWLLSDRVRQRRSGG